MKGRILFSVMAFSVAISHAASIPAAEMETSMAQEEQFVSDGISNGDMSEETMLLFDEPGKDLTETQQERELTDNLEISDSLDFIDDKDIIDTSELIDISDSCLLEDQLEELETEYIDVSDYGMTEEDTYEMPFDANLLEEGTGETSEQSFGPALVDMGTCGPYIYWKLYADGSLHIEGSGSWDTFTDTKRPGYANFKNQITSLEIADTIDNIGNYAFYGMDKIEKVTFSETSALTDIRIHAFEGCTVLKEFVFPDRLLKIGDYAFTQCKSLVEADLPDGLTTIGLCAFSNCTSLEFAFIPSSVTKIDAVDKSGPFKGCYSSILRVYADFENKNKCGSTWYAYIPYTPYTSRTVAYYWKNLPADIVSLKLPDNIDRLPAYAFRKFKNLKWLYIPATCTKSAEKDPGYDWFDDMYQAGFFGDVNPYIFTENLDPPFNSTPDLKRLYREYDVSEFDFWSNLDLTVEKLVIPEGIRMVPAYLFENSTTLKEIEFPSTMATIRPYAFSGCKLIESVTLPENLSVLGEGGFYNCTSLSSISKIPQYLTALESLSFAKTALEEIEIPFSVYTVSSDAFKDCRKLKKVTMAKPFSIKDTGMETLILTGGSEIPNDAYSHSSLKTVVFPKTLKRIGNNAFNSCGYLTNVILPSGLETIGYLAFAHCKSLGTIYIPDTVTTLGQAGLEPADETYTKAPFYEAGALLIYLEGEKKSTWSYYWDYNFFGPITSPVGVEATAGDHASVSNCTFEEYEFWRSLDPNAKVLEIPAYCKCIYKYVLSNMTNLEQIVISEGVTKIQWEAFANMKNLKSIQIPSSVVDIGNYFIKGCSSLRTLEFPEGFSALSSNLLSGAEALYTLVFPDTLDSISKASLKSCTSLKSLTIPFIGTDRTNPQPLSFLFGGDSYADNSTCIPSTLKEVVLTDTETLTDRTFFNCQNLEHVTLPDHLKAIPELCMSGCTSLKEIVLPKEVESINAYAFNGCSSLSSIIFTSSEMPVIGEEAFAGVTATIYYPSTWTGDLPALENCTWENYDCTTKHLPGEAQVVREANCTQTGLSHATCKVCGAEIEEEIPALGHEYGDWVVTQDPSCTETGSKEKSCARCGDKVVEEIPANGHTWEEDYTTDMEATCTEDGQKSVHCSVCHVPDPDRLIVIPAVGHDYEETSWNWSEDLMSASVVVTCKHDASHIETIKAAVNTEVQTEPTYKNEGLRVYTASAACGNQQFTDTKTSALEMLPPNGKTPEGLLWKVENGTLSIEVAADAIITEIPDFTTENPAPWTAAAKELSPSRIVIEDGITKVGANAFSELTGITEIDLPRTLLQLSEDAIDESVIQDIDIHYAGSQSEWNALTEGGKLSDANMTSSHVHVWDEGVITVTPTTETPGVKTYTCNDCKETRTEPIDKLPKTEQDTITPAPMPKPAPAQREKITVTSRPTLKKLKVKKNTITVTWKHFKHSSGKGKKLWKKIKTVQIQVSTDKAFRSIDKDIKLKKSKTRTTIKKLKKKTKYYVRVRYFDGIGYSIWSNLNSIKTKK